MWNLPKKTGFFTPWFLLLYIKKLLRQHFSKVFQSRIHINVEIAKLYRLKQFDMASTFFLLFLIVLKNNKWFDSPWGCYLTNFATLVFTTFKISKLRTFLWCLTWNVLEPPDQNSKQWSYTNIRCNLTRKNVDFTSWFVHLYIKKVLWQYLQVFWAMITLNVEINKLDCLKQFDMTSTSFLLCFKTFDR